MGARNGQTPGEAVPPAGGTGSGGETGGWITVPEAARFLGVGRKMVYQLVEFGELDAARSGGHVRISRSSVEAFRRAGKRI